MHLIPAPLSWIVWRWLPAPSSMHGSARQRMGDKEAPVTARASSSFCRFASEFHCQTGACLSFSSLFFSPCELVLGPVLGSAALLISKPETSPHSVESSKARCECGEIIKAYILYGGRGCNVGGGLPWPLLHYLREACTVFMPELDALVYEANGPSLELPEPRNQVGNGCLQTEHYHSRRTTRGKTKPESCCIQTKAI